LRIQYTEPRVHSHFNTVLEGNDALKARLNKLQKTMYWM
jgi:hypothetical protein